MDASADEPRPVQADPAQADPARPEATLPAWLLSPRLHLLLLALACFGVYANGFDHSFNLDSRHVALENPSVRSLANIPSFFTDPGTFTSLRSNVDYRPVLQVTYALDYALGGYRMAQWHTTQVLLHLACALGLYFLCRRVLLFARGEAAGNRLIAFGSALVFAVHPVHAGVVDYISARSSLLTAALVLPAIVLYMVPVESKRYARPAWVCGLLLGLALFTKVEAVACLGVFLLFDVWQTARERGHRAGFFRDVLGTARWRTLARLAPALALTLLYFVVRAQVMAPFEYGAARVRPDVGVWDYLLTQPVALWHYVGRWFLAVELVADDAAFPVYRTPLDAAVLAALGTWTILVAFLLATWKELPYLTFLSVSALALISPTSSVFPLAEMVNEHRPYLPLAVFSLVWFLPFGSWALRLDPRRHGFAWVAGSLGLLALVLALGKLTRERNLVFATRASYWEDVLAKTPHHRAHVNYGLTFLSDGDYDTALHHFLASLETAPYWHITHINLGITYEQLGQPVKAQEHYDRAVDYDQFSGSAHTHRGQYRLRRGLWAPAAEDFVTSMPRSLEHHANWKGLATARAGLGDAGECYAAIQECLRLDREATTFDMVAILSPFFLDPARYQAGIDVLQKLESDYPDTWWIHHNIATLARGLNQLELAASAMQRYEELKPEGQ